MLNEGSRLAQLMFCAACGRPYNYKRSQFCTACAAGHTVLTELGEEWPSESLRRLGEDIAVSAARHIRALRLYSGADLRRAPAAAPEERPEPVRRREEAAVPQPERVERSPLARHRRERARSPQGARASPVRRKSLEPRRRSRSVPARESSQKEKVTVRPKAETEVSSELFSPSYSYYTSEDEKHKEGDKLNQKEEGKRELPGVVPKAKAAKEASAPAAKAATQSAEPLKLESKAEVEQKQIRAEIASASTTEIGSKEDKEQSKQAYLKSLEGLAEQRRRAEERPVAEATAESGGASLKSGQLALSSDYRSKEEKTKRRRRRK